MGRATAVALARSDAQIVGIDICDTVDPRFGVTPATREDLDETGRLVQSTGRSWRKSILDQRDLSALRATAAEIELQYGGIDILFANAGGEAQAA